MQELRIALEALTDAVRAQADRDGWPDDDLWLHYLGACMALGRAVPTTARTFANLETCPACQGHATSTMFWDGTDEDGEPWGEVEDLICPFCLGEGMIPAGPEHWPLLGARLRLARLRNLHVWRWDDAMGRYMFTMEDGPLRPMPLAFVAQRWDVPERLLARCERGETDPRAVASHLRHMRRADVEGVG